MIKELKIARSFAGRVGAIAGGSVIALTIWMGLGGSMRAAPPVDAPTCLPTCAVNDARMLVVAGNDDTTLAAVAITLGLSFTDGNASGNANFQLFDGDRSGNWDTPYFPGNLSAPQLIIEVFADPAGVGAGPDGTGLHRWTPGQPVTDPMVTTGEHGAFPTANNAFLGVEFPQDPSAQSGSTFKYAVKIRPQNPETDKGWNAFKMRAEGRVLLLGNQVVGFIAALPTIPDFSIVYPNFDMTLSPASLANPTYNGAWTFQTTLPPFLGDVTVFDGDMDFGDNDCAYNDTDDPDTANGIPPFASPATTFNEGVAQAVSPEPSAKFCNGVDNTPFPFNPTGIRTGLPADDSGGPQWERKPLTTVPDGIAYKMVAPGGPKYPGGQTFINANPSGNREWEQFKIQLVAGPADFPLGLCPTTGGWPGEPEKSGYAPSGPYPASDCRTDELPGGVWNIELEGMDMQNLNFWFFSFKVEPQTTEYSIGRLVWYDANSDGIQDLCGPPPGTPCAPELGIEGVSYTVFNSAAVPVRSGQTDANGEFLETGLPADDYTVVIGATNFDPGQPLVGLTSTTGGETETGIEVGLPVCTDTNVPVGCGMPQYNEAIFGYVAPPPPTRFIVIDEDSIDNGIGPNFFNAQQVNDQKAKIGLRAVLPRFDGIYIGTELTLYTGQTMDEGWFSVPTIPPSWAAAGPTDDGLKNFVGVGNAVGPGLGKGKDPEKLLDKIPDVTPWNSAMLYASVGETFCAVVYDSDVSVNYNPLNGSLKGANLGIVAFQVLEVTERTGSDSSSSSLPKVRLLILNANEVCGGLLNNQLPQF